MHGDVYSTKEHPVNARDPRAKLQRQAWAAAARAMDEPPGNIYCVNPDDRIVLYRPTVTVTVVVLDADVDGHGAVVGLHDVAAGSGVARY